MEADTAATESCSGFGKPLCGSACPVRAEAPAEPSSEGPRVQQQQNHRMFGVGRNLCGSSTPTPNSLLSLSSRSETSFSRQRGSIQLLASLLRE